MGAGASASAESVSRVEATFAVIDTNVSGDIDAAEIGKFIQGCGLTEWAAAAKGQEWIARFDKDMDKKATIDEFKTFFSAHLEEYGEKATQDLLDWFEELGKKMIAEEGGIRPTKTAALAEVGADMRSEATTAVEVSGGFVAGDATATPAAAALAAPDPDAGAAAGAEVPAEATATVEGNGGAVEDSAATETSASAVPAAATAAEGEAPAAAPEGEASAAPAAVVAGAEMRSEATNAVEVSGGFVAGSTA